MSRLALGVIALVAWMSLPQSSALEPVLSKAGEVALGLQKERGLLADENYVQIYRVSGDANREVTTASAPPLGEWTGHRPRKIRSQFVLLSDPGSETGWTAFRDAFEVDGRKLRPEQDRLEKLFSRPLAEAVPEAMVLSEQAIKHNQGKMARSVHPPTLALTVLLPPHQQAFTFTKKGEKKVGGVTAWVVGYTETAGGKFAVTVEGVPQPIRGELWIDPASGRVMKSQVVMDALDAYPDMKLHPERYLNFPRSVFEVTYGLDARLNLWLPMELKENYDRRVEVVTTTATYSNYRRIGV